MIERREPWNTRFRERVACVGGRGRGCYFDIGEAVSVRKRIVLAGVERARIEKVASLARARPEFDLVAVADTDRAAADRCAAKYAVKAWYDYDAMLDEMRPDAVAIGGAFYEHGRLVADALRRGCHVICDKPLCVSLDELESIEQSVVASPGLMVHLLLEKRFWPETVATKALIESGELGDIALAWASGPHKLLRETRPGWMFDPQQYGGIINDLAVHDIDLLLYLTGAQAADVQAMSGQRAESEDPGFEDYSSMAMRTDKGLLANVEVHWLSPAAAPYHGDYHMILTGTQGTADLRFVNHTVTVATHTEGPREIALGGSRHPAEDFLDALRDEAVPEITTRQALAATRLALLAQENANSGSWSHWSAPGAYSHP
jgi:predicted dehydrogenase